MRGRDSRARHGCACIPTVDSRPPSAQEVGRLAWRYRPASTSASAAVVLPGNQPPVPAENGVRRDDAGDLRQNPPAEFLASHRESTALGVGQAKWTWAKLLPEDPILLPEIIDHVFLVAVHPASGREYEEAQSVGHSLRLLREQPLAPTLFRRFANLGRFVAPYADERSRSPESVFTIPGFGVQLHRNAHMSFIISEIRQKSSGQKAAHFGQTQLSHRVKYFSFTGRLRCACSHRTAASPRAGRRPVRRPVRRACARPAASGRWAM